MRPRLGEPHEQLEIVEFFFPEPERLTEPADFCLREVTLPLDNLGYKPFRGKPDSAPQLLVRKAGSTCFC